MKLPNTVEPDFVKRTPSGSKKVPETGAYTGMIVESIEFKRG